MCRCLPAARLSAARPRVYTLSETTPMPRKPIPAMMPEQIERFWSKVERRGIDDCWEWQRGRDKDGYGSVKFRPHGQFRAARVAFYLGHAKQPGDLLVCHTCDNPACCNPRHLWLGTNTDNIADRSSKGRTARQLGEAHGLTTLTNDAVSEILQSSDTQRALARRYQVDPMTISNIWRRVVWRHVAPDIPARNGRSKEHTRRGSQHPRAKLTEQAVRHIRQASETAVDLAALYGVSETAIRYARDGRTWNHVL
jgi:hypothetical protein